MKSMAKKLLERLERVNEENSTTVSSGGISREKAESLFLKTLEEFKDQNWDILGYNYVRDKNGKRYNLGRWCDKCAPVYKKKGGELFMSLSKVLDPRDADINLLPKVLGSFNYDEYCDEWSSEIKNITEEEFKKKYPVFGKIEDMLSEIVNHSEYKEDF